MGAFGLRMEKEIKKESIKLLMCLVALPKAIISKNSDKPIEKQHIFLIQQIRRAVLKQGWPSQY